MLLKYILFTQEGVDCIHLDQDKNIVMSLRAPQNAGKLSNSSGTVSFSRTLLHGVRYKISTHAFVLIQTQITSPSHVCNIPIPSHKIIFGWMNI